MRVSFADFVLDTEARQLFRRGAAVHLEPKALDLLELLLARRPEALSKTEIRGALWPDTFVSESSLTGLVAQVRKALGDDRRQQLFLRTVHGFGYAFSGAIGGAQWSPDPTPRLIWEESVFLLSPGDTLIGRSEDALVRIDSPGVSRRHARIAVTGDGATIEDLGSKNGTFVGDRRVDGPTPIRDGARLLLGRQLLVFRRGGSATPTLTDTPPPLGGA